jgi:hypothetical protein
LDLLATFILTINDFVETTLIVCVQILIDYNCCTFLIWAINSAELADNLVRIHFLSFKADLATIFKQALSLIWAVNNFKRTILTNMVINFTFFNIQAALVLARNDSLGAFILYMLFHLIKSEVLSALE